jgi:hypothetical protein
MRWPFWLLSRDILIYNLIADKESLIRRSFEPTLLLEGKVPVVVPEIKVTFFYASQLKTMDKRYLFQVN